MLLHSQSFSLPWLIVSLHIQRYEYQQFHIAPDHAPGKRLTAAERLQRNRQYTQQFGANNTSTAARETSNGNGGGASHQGGHRRQNEVREPSAERDNSSVELEYADAQLFHDRNGHSNKSGEPEHAEEDFSLSASLAKNVASVSQSVQQLQVRFTVALVVV
jgi:E3 ubiquitin-protein ligase DOA10